MPSRPFATTSFNKASQFDHNLCLFAVGPLKAPIQKLPVNTSALFVQHIKTKKISILSRSFQTHIDRFWILMNVFSTLYLMAFCSQTKVLCQSSRCPENVDGAVRHSLQAVPQPTWFLLWNTIESANLAENKTSSPASQRCTLGSPNIHWRCCGHGCGRTLADPISMNWKPEALAQIKRDWLYKISCKQHFCEAVAAYPKNSYATRSGVPDFSTHQP